MGKQFHDIGVRKRVKNFRDNEKRKRNNPLYRFMRNPRYIVTASTPSNTPSVGQKTYTDYLGRPWHPL